MGDCKVDGIEGRRTRRGIYHAKTEKKMRNSSTLREGRLGFPLDEG